MIPAPVSKTLSFFPGLGLGWGGGNGPDDGPGGNGPSYRNGYPDANGNILYDKEHNYGYMDLDSDTSDVSLASATAIDDPAWKPNLPLLFVSELGELTDELNR